MGPKGDQALIDIHFLLLQSHPGVHSRTAISRNRNESRDFVMRKVTLSPTHGSIGDPLPIYADRFFGHYGISSSAERIYQLPLQVSYWGKKTGQICWREKSSVSDFELSSLAGFFAHIRSNLCTRHIQKKLTPRGHHDWPDMGVIRQPDCPVATSCGTKSPRHPRER